MGDAMTSSALSFSLCLAFVLSAGTHGFTPASPAAAAQEITLVKPLHIGGSIKPPKLILSTPPIYPSEAAQKRIEGTVEVYTWIQVDGTTSHVRVVRGVKGLDRAAEEAVRSYRFQPAELQGKPVLVHMYVDVVFKLP